MGYSLGRGVAIVVLLRPIGSWEHGRIKKEIGLSLLHNLVA